MDLSLSIRAIKDLFSFPFHDPKWGNKFLIGSGITLAGIIVPILPWLLVWGYMARLIRAGARNEDASILPEWDDWGDLLTDGLRQIGVTLIFMLPATIVMGAGWLFYMIGMFSVVGSSNAPSASNGSVLFMLVSMPVFFLSMGLGMLLAMAGWLFMPAAQSHVAVNRRFSALFDVSGWWRVMRANFSGFVITAAVFFILEIALMLVFQFLYMTLVLCLLIPLVMFPAAFYIFLLVYRLAGQAYGEGSTKAAGAAEVAPPVPPAAAPAAI